MRLHPSTWRASVAGLCGKCLPASVSRRSRSKAHQVDKRDSLTGPPGARTPDGWGCLVPSVAVLALSWGAPGLDPASPQCHRHSGWRPCPLSCVAFKVVAALPPSPSRCPDPNQRQTTLASGPESPCCSAMGPGGTGMCGSGGHSRLHGNQEGLTSCHRPFLSEDGTSTPGGGTDMA